eukprot:4567730-Prymnesium_polylepis.2
MQTRDIARRGGGPHRASPSVLCGRPSSRFPNVCTPVISTRGKQMVMIAVCSAGEGDSLEGDRLFTCTS